MESVSSAFAVDAGQGSVNYGRAVRVLALRGCRTRKTKNVGDGGETGGCETAVDRALELITSDNLGDGKKMGA